MANIGQIVAEITANTAGLRRAQQDASRQFGQIQNEADATAKAVKIAFAVAASAAVLMFVKALASAADGANETKKAMMGLQSTSRAFGQNFDDATKSVKELYSDGIMPLDKSIRGFKNLLSVGFSVDEAMQVSKAMKNIGAFNNVIGDLGQAYEDSTKGLKTNSMELIENIGLTQRISAVLKAANVDFSDGIDLTNNAAQRRAVYNAILAEGVKFEGDAAKLANDNASANAKLSAAWKEMSDNLGNRVAPAFSSVLGLMTKTTQAMSSVFEGSKMDKLTKSFEENRIELQIMSDTYFSLKGRINKTTSEQELFEKTIDALKTKYPDFLKNVDMHNTSNATMLKLLKNINTELRKNFLIEAQKAVMEDATKTAIEYKKAEIKQLERIEELKSKQKNGTPYRGWLGSYENEIKSASELSGIYATKGAEYIAKAKKRAEYFAKDLSELLDDVDTNFREPDDITAYNKKNKNDTKKSENEVKTEIKTTKKEWKPDTSKTLEQKKKELEYNLKADLANAKEEEKYLIYLKYNQAVKVAEAEDKYAKAIASAKTQKAAKDAMDTLIKSVGESEVELNVKTKKAEYAKNALGLTDLESYGITIPIEMDGMELEIARLISEYDSEIKKLATDFINKTTLPIGLTDKSNYGVPASPKTREDEIKDEGRAKDNQDELNKAINDTISSFAALANELDNNFMKALANIAESAMSMKNSYGTFATGQAQGGISGGLGMLSGGIGMFTSAVSIFQSVGGLFHKSTYNFDEAVQKMLKGIGEKAPDIQVAEFKKAMKLKSDISALKLTPDKAGYDKLNAYLFSINMSWATYAETLEAADKIVPQLAEQLGTAAEDFGSDIASALSNTSTFSEFSENLEDNVFSSVKSGLISAFMASEEMKNLLEPLQKSITLAVADDYKISDTEMNDIKAQMEGIENIAKPFYDALEAVGLNLVDASDSLASESDRLSSTINRNLRLAERIQMTSTGSNQVINIDFTGANLGGVSEASMVGIINRATAQSNIAKNGVR